MARKRYNAEEIIHRLWEADVLLGQGETVGQVCKQLGVVEHNLLSMAQSLRWHEDRPGPTARWAIAHLLLKPTTRRNLPISKKPRKLTFKLDQLM